MITISTIVLCLNGLAILTAIIKWKQLPNPFRVFLGIMLFSFLIARISSVVANHNPLYYVNALFAVTMYGFLLSDILQKIIDARFIWASVALVWLIIGSYLFQYGLNNYQLQILIPFDLLVSFFSGFYIINFLLASNQNYGSIFFLTAYLFVSFSIALFIDLISNFLHGYLSDSFLNLLWKEIVPVYNVVKVITILLIILSVKPKLPSLDKMPSFES